MDNVSYCVSYEDGQFLCCDWYYTEQEARDAASKVKGPYQITERTGVVPQHTDRTVEEVI